MKKTESGMALVSVLCLLMLVSLLVTSAVVLSKYAEMDSYTYSHFTLSSYSAEGAATRIYWLLMNDRKKNPQRNIVAEQNVSDAENERYLADGVSRNLKDYAENNVLYKIIDAVSGLDVSGSMPQRDILFSSNNSDTDPNDKQKYELIVNRILDYVDIDDMTRINGMESKDYLELGMPHLPRNRPLQFREELWWIPGILEICPHDESGRMSGIRLIAPLGLTPITGRPNLYSTPVEQIAFRCHLSPLEAEQLKEAFVLWRNERKMLQDTLPVGFLKRLEMFYSNSESGFYTLLIDTSESKQPGIRLAVTFKTEFSNKKFIEFYEYMFY